MEALRLRYKQKQDELFPKPAGAPVKSKKAKLAVPEKTPLPKNLSMLDQPGIKPFTPPGSYLWKSKGGGGAWHLKVKGWPGEFSRSVSKYGDAYCLLLLLSKGWYSHVLLTPGMHVEDVPVAGLLCEEEVNAHW